MALRLETVATCLADFARVPGRYVVIRTKGIRTCGRWEVTHIALAKAAGRLAAGHPSEALGQFGVEIESVSVIPQQMVFTTANNYRFEINRVEPGPKRPESFSKRPPNARIR